MTLEVPSVVCGIGTDCDELDEGWVTSDGDERGGLVAVGSTFTGVDVGSGRTS